MHLMRSLSVALANTKKQTLKNNIYNICYMMTWIFQTAVWLLWIEASFHVSLISAQRVRWGFCTMLITSWMQYGFHSQVLISEHCFDQGLEQITCYNCDQWAMSTYFTDKCFSWWLGSMAQIAMIYITNTESCRITANNLPNTRD